MLALATSVAVVNLCGRLVTVLLYALAPTLEKVINIDYKGKKKICGACFIFGIRIPNSEKIQRQQCNFLKLK